MLVEGSASLDFNERPILVFWELTKACKLKCRHCRAEAIPEPLEDELSGEEASNLLEDMRGFGEMPSLVFTGGDPLMRRDLRDLMDKAFKLGMRIAVAPAVTDLLDDNAIYLLRKYNPSISISLDGIEETHDFIRDERGNFKRTLGTLKKLSGEFKLQVNTLVCEESVRDLSRVAFLLKRLKIKAWELFFLVKVGRGIVLEELSPEECEDVAHFLYEVSRYGIDVRTVEAPFFRRVADVRSRSSEVHGFDPERIAEEYGLGSLYIELTKELIELLGPPERDPKVRSMGTRDGHGVIFVAHNGDVYPSGFAPLKLANVREKSLVEIYRESEVLKRIRRAEFRGRCGRCEYKHVCGGSRARALASKGDILEEDPACIYEPF